MNGVQLLKGPLLFDVTRHPVINVASRTAHTVVTGVITEPEAQAAIVTIRPADVHLTMLGFGGSPSMCAYAELSDEGKRQYWDVLKRYNLPLLCEYPRGTQLKPDLGNFDDVRDAAPHCYGDNFPNSEVSDFDCSRHFVMLRRRADDPAEFVVQAGAKYNVYFA